MHVRLLRGAVSSPAVSWGSQLLRGAVHQGRVAAAAARLCLVAQDGAVTRGDETSTSPGPGRSRAATKHHAERDKHITQRPRLRLVAQASHGIAKQPQTDGREAALNPIQRAATQLSSPKQAMAWYGSVCLPGPSRRRRDADAECPLDTDRYKTRTPRFDTPSNTVKYRRDSSHGLRAIPSPMRWATSDL